MSKVKHICEYGTIWNAKDFYPDIPGDSVNCIYVENDSFENLKDFVAENNDPSKQIEEAFSYQRRKGIDFIRVKNYVGIIETRHGTMIEILPKIHTENDEDEISKIKESRSILLSMLCTLKDSPFKSMDKAHLNSARMPILEIFISIFLKELENLVKRGIKHFYRQNEQNQLFLKGRLLFDQQLKQNMIRPDRFFVQYDEFNIDIPQNRILKTALSYLGTKSKSTKNLSQIHSLLELFDEVDTCQNLKGDFAKINGQNRLFNYYNEALTWAKLFLEEKSFTSYKGNYLNTAILFPMEILFESYVASRIKYQYPDYSISTQHRKHFLLTDLKLKEKKFRIRPDIVIENAAMLIIADTKWKVIDQNQSSKNYLISQPDMYQLYAYGKKYQSNNLVLISPECETFTDELLFSYDEEMTLRCVPWSFKRENQVFNIQLELPLQIERTT